MIWGVPLFSETSIYHIYKLLPHIKRCCKIFVSTLAAMFFCSLTFGVISEMAPYCQAIVHDGNRSTQNFQATVDASEVLNNHLGCKKTLYISGWITKLNWWVCRISEPSTVFRSTSFLVTLSSVSLEAPPFWGVEKVKQTETQAVLDKDDSHNNQPNNKTKQHNKTKQPTSTNNK